MLMGLDPVQRDFSKAIYRIVIRNISPTVEKVIKIPFPNLRK